ncbi:phenylalanine--tRNA ligase subunit alpha [Gloeobacter kilaueensis]|uniref:Phenylalanine--tRNA ligase alpha subunit n=1 Tax=Gloeobacter kilaueensis (strain ATCC BAA-2537 / CCAP 1431/1 / ULC 316 / JS1) TaxID=1183438 RepID=U5QL78_GLOK1|nr:phenylalanine--tRNA ligase subunit alpha [Gloeobacter kilaueensis]AGY59691.1 phenylalanyl-tRNA synthetase subunit alpha [Gloeobacter kilaueensis JS1]
MKDQLDALQLEALGAIHSAADLNVLERIRVDFLGKKGRLSAILGGMGRLSTEERPLVGALANKVKARIEEALEAQRLDLEEQQIARRLEAEHIDVTMPGRFVPPGRLHPLTSTTDRIVDVFVGLGFTVATGPQIETDYYNFEALNTPADHPARDMQDTFYLSDGLVLRTQTSSVQIRYMEENEPPIRICAPGRVYRRDQVTNRHSPVFHQVEILAVDEEITFGDLKGTLTFFTQELFGDRPVRFRPSYFPFTEPSAEVDVQCRFCGGRGCRVCSHTGWLEIAGCGMVDPNVFQAVGYDPEKVQGFAAGMGIERIAMLLYDISDIRLFYTNDWRFLRQF